MLGVLLGERGLKERCHRLRRVFSGGEALTWEMQERFYGEMGEGVELVNLYGPTEASIDTTSCRSERARRHRGQTVPIGRPIANAQVYILDTQMKPVATGVGGELYIGGAGLARGYEQRAELTAEKFVPHPYSTRGGERLYRTGDVARYLPDGRIEFLGRLDHQVKIHGFRIEIGEVEAALATHPSVRQCVVIAREDVPGEKHLVAYLVGAGAGALKVNEWRAYLKERLPEYMIPSAFIVLDELPLMTNGKLNKQALPSPWEVRPQLEKKFVAPRTPVEEVLAQVWADVLHLPQVGVDDNFFDLGGDSIRSIQVKAQAQKHGIDFSIERLFQHQTIAALAQDLQTPGENVPPADTPVEAFSLIGEEDRPRLPSEIEDAYPIAMLQAGMLFHREYSPESALYHDIASYHLKGRLDIEALRKAVRQLAANHPVLRTSFDFNGYSEPLQLVHREADIPLEEFDLSDLTEAQQAEALAGWMEELKMRLFDPTRPPLLRFIVHQRSAGTLQFTMNCHHAILDGWSVATMVSELFHLYFQFAGGHPVAAAAAPPAVTYSDFIALEKKALASVEANDYWMQRLSDSTITSMPRVGGVDADASDHKQQPFVREVLMSQEISEGLRGLARTAGTPLRSVLLTAHLRVLSLLGGRADVLTGLVSNCRPEEADAERALGLFLNTVPFRMNMREGSWVELVQRTFEAEREMLPHRWFPLAEIQHRLGVRPLFEAVFNFIHFHVYESVSGFDDMQPLSTRTFEQTNYPLTASFVQESATQQINVGLECDPSIFSEDQVGAILHYYIKALEAMSAEPEARHEDCTLLSDAEQHRLLKEWNKTQPRYSLEHPLHILFEQQTARTPDAIALVSDEDHQQLSYSQLNTRANQLAHLLISSGVTPDARVALLFERSTDMLVTLIATLKAGAAYLP
ncbi:MAG: condensation domain-containing protein, partial [Acidobacteria bacterium]|nr:condensation domain-containing protein [Acidobacteriota bacterium]MCA1626537.1 condensation domain-containing protein [Acidobacteriota bacterium]